MTAGDYLAFSHGAAGQHADVADMWLSDHGTVRSGRPHGGRPIYARVALDVAYRDAFQGRIRRSISLRIAVVIKPSIVMIMMPTNMASTFITSNDDQIR